MNDYNRLRVKPLYRRKKMTSCEGLLRAIARSITENCPDCGGSGSVYSGFAAEVFAPTGERLYGGVAYSECSKCKMVRDALKEPQEKEDEQTRNNKGELCTR